MNGNRILGDLDTSIPDWLIDHPETAPVFREWGLDTSCAGKSLEYVCQQQGHDPRVVLEQLVRAVTAHSNGPPGPA